MKREYRLIDMQDKTIQTIKVGRITDKLFPWVSHLVYTVFGIMIGIMIASKYFFSVEQQVFLVLTSIVVSIMIEKGYEHFLVERDEWTDDQL